MDRHRPPQPVARFQSLHEICNVFCAIVRRTVVEGDDGSISFFMRDVIRKSTAPANGIRFFHRVGGI